MVRTAVVPGWLAEVVRPRRAPVPWPEMIRAALAICVPLSAALALGRGPLGVLPAMGGLLGTLADTGGPYLSRVKRVCRRGGRRRGRPGHRRRHPTAMFLTPLVVVLIDLLGPAGWRLAEDRLIDTLIGCAIVLLIGFAPWPMTWYSHLPRQYAQTALDMCRYMEEVLGSGPGSGLV